MDPCPFAPVFVLKLRPLPGVDATRALRFVLKSLLRQHGLRCVSVEEESEHASLPENTVEQTNR